MSDNRVVIEFNHNNSSYSLHFIVNGNVVGQPVTFPSVNRPEDFADALLKLQESAAVAYARFKLNV